MATPFPEDLICPVCREIFKDPVILTCRHSMCRVCLVRFWKSTHSRRCPVCRRKCSKEHYPPNMALENQCESYTEGQLNENKCVDCQEDTARSAKDHSPTDKVGANREPSVRGEPSSSHDHFPVYVFGFGGTRKCLMAKSTDTTSQLKNQLLEEHTHLRRMDLRWTYANQHLFQDKCLGHQGVERGATLFAIPRLAGG